MRKGYLIFIVWVVALFEEFRITTWYGYSAVSCHPSLIEQKELFEKYYYLYGSFFTIILILPILFIIIKHLYRFFKKENIKK